MYLFPSSSSTWLQKRTEHPTIFYFPWPFLCNILGLHLIILVSRTQVIISEWNSYFFCLLFFPSHMFLSETNLCISPKSNLVSFSLSYTGSLLSTPVAFNFVHCLVSCHFLFFFIFRMIIVTSTSLKELVWWLNYMICAEKHVKYWTYLANLFYYYCYNKVNSNPNEAGIIHGLVYIFCLHVLFLPN